MSWKIYYKMKNILYHEKYIMSWKIYYIMKKKGRREITSGM